MSDRYEGKPFLRFLDCYVMDAIGALDPDIQITLADMAPSLERTFGNGHWREVVTEQMDFPPDLPDRIREIWETGRQKFLEVHGEEPDPGEFARQFVDTNFAPEAAGDE